MSMFLLGDDVMDKLSPVFVLTYANQEQPAGAVLFDPQRSSPGEVVSLPLTKRVVRH